MRLRHIVFWILALSLSGCAIFGPNYKKPKVNVADKWSSQDKQSLVTSESGLLANLAWWQGFKDPRLNSLIESALFNNNNIEIAIGNITQAQGALEQVQLAWVPTMSGQVSYSNSGTFNGVASNTQLYTGKGGAGYSTGLVPTYSLNIVQQIRQQQAAKAGLLANQYAKDATRLSIISQVAGSYFTLLGQKEQLKWQKQLTSDLSALLEINNAQYKAGYISLLTLQTTDQQYNQALSQVTIIENNIVATQNALQVLVNQNPGEITNPGDFTKLPLDGIIPSNLPSQVLQNRPDIIEAEMQLMQANANIGVATSNYFPTISLTGAGGYASNGLSTLFNAGNDYWNDQLQATMPFLNLSFLGTIKGAKGAYYSAYYNYILTVRNAFAQVDNGLAAHQKLMDSYKATSEVYDSSKLAYDLGVDRFKGGADSMAGVLNYKVIYDNAAISLVEAKLNELQAIVNLYQALAGGYNVNNTEKPKKFGDSHDA